MFFHLMENGYVWLVESNLQDQKDSIQKILFLNRILKRNNDKPAFLNVVNTIPQNKIKIYTGESNRAALYSCCPYCQSKNYIELFEHPYSVKCQTEMFSAYWYHCKSCGRNFIGINDEIYGRSNWRRLVIKFGKYCFAIWQILCWHISFQTPIDETLLEKNLPFKWFRTFMLPDEQKQLDEYNKFMNYLIKKRTEVLQTWNKYFDLEFTLHYWKIWEKNNRIIATNRNV